MAPAEEASPKLPARLARARVRATLAILGILAAGVLLYCSGVMGGNQVAAMAIGGVVGAVEILGRYRHAPARAVLTGNGVVYILINVGAAWAAYYMLNEFQVFKDRTVAKDLVSVLTAGFGSLVFMRSSIFKVRVGESDIGIGPAAVLDTLLLIADRGVDRREAVARAQDVTELVSRVRDPRVVAKMLTKYSLALMQNVDERTSQDLGDAVSKIMADPEIPDPIKIDIVALRLGIVVGPDVLEAAVAALGDRLNTTSIEAPPKPPPPEESKVPPTGPVEVPTVEALKAEIDKATQSGG